MVSARSIDRAPELMRNIVHNGFATFREVCLAGKVHLGAACPCMRFNEKVEGSWQLGLLTRTLPERAVMAAMSRSATCPFRHSACEFGPIDEEYDEEGKGTLDPYTRFDNVEEFAHGLILTMATMLGRLREVRMMDPSACPICHNNLPRTNIKVFLEEMKSIVLQFERYLVSRR
jgi:hypothetical protein